VEWHGGRVPRRRSEVEVGLRRYILVRGGWWLWFLGTRRRGGTGASGGSGNGHGVHGGWSRRERRARPFLVRRGAQAMRKGEAKLSTRSIRPEDERWRSCASADGGSTVAANREKARDGSVAAAFIRAGQPVKVCPRLREVGNMLKDVPRFWKRLGGGDFEHDNG